MAKVNVQVAGGSIQQKEAATVGDLKRIMQADNYVATVNGEPADDGYSLEEYEFVALSKPVKAG